MIKTKNAEVIEGYVYSHDLTIKTVQNQSSKNFGKPFISGTIDVAVDEEGLNVIQNHYTYVAEVTNAGGKNQTYSALEKIINENRTWSTVGKENAMKVKLQPSLDVMAFYNSEGELIEAKRNEGGFVTIVTSLNPKIEERSTFKADMVITNVKRNEANEERKIPETASVRGAIFNFRNELLPVEFTVTNPQGIDYFENLGASSKEPIFTELWGVMNNVAIEREIVTENAFGPAKVDTVKSSQKRWIITGMNPVPYEFSEESKFLTPAELTTKMQDRETKLAEEKKRHDEYVASKAAATPSAFGSAPTPSTGVASGDFKF